MNWAHVKAFVWLRWRLTVNQIRRSGPGGTEISVIFTGLMLAGGVLALLIGFAVGFVPLRAAPSRVVMMVWDGAIVGFVLFWTMGLISELQRSDDLSFDRFLHLPVSPTGAFLINYLGSSVGLSLVLFLPAMMGLAAGLVLSRGAGMLSLFPMVAAFFLMMTAVTYQFRGWLASMMKNPRRRRTIVAFVPILLILSFQLPSLWNQFSPGARERRAARAEAHRLTETLGKDLAAGRITQEEHKARLRAAPARNADDGYAVARLFNRFVPPGWLALGAEAAADGRAWPPLASVLGMSLIGVASLRRAYGTTIRLYTGDFDKGRRPGPLPAPRVSSGPRVPVHRSSILEMRIPWTSERVSAVAVSGFRSWIRAPEAKMTLLTPVIMLIVFAGAFTGRGGTSSELVRPLTASGLAGLLLILGMIGPIGNQFGYDRTGFRAFVLGPIPRRDVLIGKNLSFFPLALVTMLAVVGLAQWSNPMRLDHLAAVLLQLTPMYLLFCLAGNLLSIIGPMTLRPGSGMPAPHQGLRSFYPLVFMPLVAASLALTLLPLGIEALLSAMDVFTWFPAYLAFGVVQAVVTVWVYRRVVAWEGSLLQRREQQILEIVGSRGK